MPADYQSAAEALAVSPSRSPSPHPWPSNRPDTQSTRRLSSTRIRSLNQNPSRRERLRHAWTYVEAYNQWCMDTYNRMSVLQRCITLVGILAIYALIVVGWIYSHRLFDWLAGVRESWRALPGGWLIVFFMVFVTAFPPVFGYSTATTISGFVYGFPWGWPIVAAACTLGSLAAFIAARTVLSKRVDRMVGKDPRFVALGQVLRRDGIWYLTGIRFCPLPFSLSNGFLATIPSISPLAFTVSTALSSPKLLVHIFIGSRLAILAESGDDMSFGDKFINYLSMAIGGGIGLAVGWIIYRRTMARAAEIAREEEAGAQEEGRVGSTPYLDREDTLMDPEDAAALMSDDDLSLWETQVDEDAEEGSEDGRKKKTSQQEQGDGRSSPW